MAWRDALDLQVLRGVSGKLENFGGKVLQHGSEIDGCLGTDARLLAGDVAEVALYATAWELLTTRSVPRYARTRFCCLAQEHETRRNRGETWCATKTHRSS